MTKAFDLACFMPVNPTVVGDTVVITAANPVRTDWAAMVSGGAFVPAPTAQGQTIVANGALAWTASAPVPGEAPTDGKTYGRGGASWAPTWSRTEADARYQAADPDLSAIAGLSGTGLLQCTGAGAWSFIQDFDAGTY